MRNEPVDVHNNSIAIVGLSGRFPGANNIEEFWDNLIGGVESISFFDGQNADVFTAAGTNRTKACGAMENIDLFDGPFFGFSAFEAEMLDPQYRIFLEEAWSAIEHAGYNPQEYGGLIGVFAGLSASSHASWRIISHRDSLESTEPLTAPLLSDDVCLASLTANRLNLKGPGITVQSSCSASLIAVHLACQSLLSYQCDFALAGGSFIDFSGRAGFDRAQAGLSADGHCRAFDVNASGAVIGEGAGVVVLKRLTDAINEGDTIHAVVRGSAINNDGSCELNDPAPRREGQAEVIATAIAVAGVDPSCISYIEANGTGTPGLDAIELDALTRVFRESTRQRAVCAIGSVKTNIGDLGPAAGVAGIIKVALAIKDRLLPPTLHFATPHPEIGINESPFYVTSQLELWRPGDQTICAGISSFSAAGANSHVILEEAPIAGQSGIGRPFQLVMLSARSHTALTRSTEHLLEWMKRNQNQNLSDAAYTLNVGRKNFKHRKFLVCNGMDDAVNAIQAQDRKRVLEGCYDGKRPRVVFMFPGLGDEYPDMGLGLYNSESVFREALDRCGEVLHSEMGIPLLDILYPGLNDADNNAGLESRRIIRDSAVDLRQMLRRPRPKPEEQPTCELNKTCYSQPAIFAVEFALAQLWMSWGIRPDALIGYSIGEYVAACISGVLTLEQAIVLAAKRAELIGTLPLSGLLAVPLSEEALSPLLDSDAAISAVNGPAMCVVAGTSDSLKKLAAALADRGVVCRPPQVQYAFHSRLMQPVAEPLTALFRTADLRPPRIPYVSNLTGNWIKDSEATDPSYWAMHTCQRIRFRDGIDLFKDEAYAAFLEVGPGQALGAWVLQNASDATDSQLVVLPSLPHTYDHTPDMAMMLRSLGRLWLAGAEPEWAGFYGSERRHRVSLPTYPFEKQRYSIDRKETRVAGRAGSTPQDQPNLAQSGQYASLLEELDLQTTSPTARIAEQKRIPKDQSQSDALSPTHARTNIRAGYVAPRTSLERRLSEVWQSILSLDDVGIYDNFFELGGDSILATQLTLRLKEAFGADLSLRSIFENPTVFDLVVAIVQRQVERAGRDEVARELAEISRLSPEELQAMLAADSSSE